ncbi:MAG: FkbM family methyltransferase [Magnetococcales bacterium]|nr:FkbM family methyltransferase [Magnetococcales bacterium]
MSALDTPSVPPIVRLKTLVPGYRPKWVRRFKTLLDHLNAIESKVTFGEEEGFPWMEIEGESYRFYGFFSGEKEITEAHLMGSALPASIEPRHLRLVKDYVTRYLYPHMRPDLSPTGINESNWAGFHGQHKETLADYEGGDPDTLRRVFTAREDDVVINGGCFVGFGDLHMAARLPKGRIYAIEADPTCYRLLCRNMERNKLENVLPIHRGLWSKEGTLKLESNHAQANTLVAEVLQGEEQEVVKTIPIDALVEQEELTRVDFISITLNGAEIETLEGASETLKRFKPRIRLPGWYFRDGKRICEHVRDDPKLADYHVCITSRGNVLAYPKS